MSLTNNSSTLPKQFDVFLCHHSEDKPQIRRIADELIKQGIRPWLDEREIKPGVLWQEALEEQISNIKSSAVFIGESGIGPWQNIEIRAFINEFVERKCPVIPVILPTAKKTPPLPILLKNLHYVDFRIINPDPFKQLSWGITGEKPELQQEFMSLVEGTSSKKPTLYYPLASPPTKDQSAQLIILTNRVDEFWVKGVLKQSLFNEVLISLGKKQTDEHVEIPWNLMTSLPKKDDEPTLIDSRIDKIFDATCSLLILGEPGSGKTTLLLELANHLLIRSKNSPTERVPIVLNLSTWAKGQNLSDWMEDNLQKTYRIPPKLAHNWLSNGFLIPLLDGLDEVKIEIQGDCVESINAYIAQNDPPGFVVSSRLKEYQWLPEKLKLSGAICIEPLNAEQIDQYFATVDPRLESLRTAIKEDEVLLDLAKSPLMLNIMSMTYQSASLETIAEGLQTIEARRDQIFNTYVDKMIQRKKPLNQLFSKEKVIAWLNQLAQSMTNQSQSVFFIENLQPSLLDTRKERFTYRGIASLAFVLALYWLAFYPALLGPTWEAMSKFPKEKWPLFLLLQFSGVLVLSIIPALAISISSNSDSSIKNGVHGFLSGFIFGLIIGLIILVFAVSDFNKNTQDQLRISLMILFGGGGWGLPIGLFNSVCVGNLNNIKAIEKVSWSWKIFFKMIGIYMLIAIPISMLIVLVMAFMEWWNTGILEAFKLGFIWGGQVGIMLGSVHGLIRGLDTQIIDKKIFPNQGIILSLKNGFLLIFYISFSTLIIVVSFELMGMPLHHIPDAPAAKKIDDYILIILFLGVVLGLRNGLGSVIKHYALRLVLWRSGKIPLKLIPFLDYCTTCILLKKVGGGYIFIHGMLQDYFAKLKTTEKSSDR